ncbi:ROK family protein [Pseudarthrobacter sp. P1]|uniref:ROK family protein n=1 Tax=Pseudarthrobacter sp. P1 TaxID=3418418 RepID=UPI003CF4293C
MASVLGVDLGGTKTAAGVVAADGTVLYSGQTPTLNRAGGEAILDATAALATSLRAQAAADGIEVSAIGMGSAGVIDAEAGTVISATDAILGWTGTDIFTGLTQRTGLDVSVVNDVHAHALGEAWLGAAAGTSSSLLVASGPAIHASFLRFGGSAAVPDTRAVFDLARGGDATARKAIGVGAGAAGQAVGGMVNILDPAVVVVSGGLADAGELWWGAMERALRQELLAPLADVPVLRATLGNTAAIVGAASLVFN